MVFYRSELAWLLLLAIVFSLLALPYLLFPFWAGSYTLFRRSSTNGETLAILLIITATLFGDRVVGCLQFLLRQL